MGHVNRCNPKLVRKVSDLELHLFAQLFVERAKRFVHQDKLGLKHQGAGKRDTLLLTTGQLRRATAAKGAHLDHLKRALDLGLAVRLADLAHFKRKAEVFGNRHMREKRIILKHHADAALVRRDVVDADPVKLDFAMGGSLEPGQHHKAGGLARPGGPKHCKKFTLGQGKVQIFDDQSLAVIALLHALKSNERVVVPGIGQVRLPVFISRSPPRSVETKTTNVLCCKSIASLFSEIRPAQVKTTISGSRKDDFPVVHWYLTGDAHTLNASPGPFRRKTQPSQEPF